DDEAGCAHLLERRAGGCPESARVGRGADAATQWASAQQRSTAPMEEAQGHGIARQHPVRARVVERQQRLRAVAINDAADATVNSVECLIPGDPLELARAFCTDA